MSLLEKLVESENPEIDRAKVKKVVNDLGETLKIMTVQDPESIRQITSALEKYLANNRYVSHISTKFMDLRGRHYGYLIKETNG